MPMTTEKIINLINNKNTKAFYLSKAWRNKRAKILSLQNYECQECKRGHRPVKAATIVHHVKHLRSHPELALTDSNLLAVCDECHNLLHQEKLKKFHSKKAWEDERW